MVCLFYKSINHFSFNFPQHIVWNFFATSHGKGPVDGIGGCTKRSVSAEVMSGRVEVRTSHDFAVVATNKCPNVIVRHISKDDIEAEVEKLNSDWEATLPIPNTKRIHKVTVLSPYVIDVQHHANASPTRHYFVHEPKASDDLNVDDSTHGDDCADACWTYGAEEISHSLFICQLSL